MFLLLGSGLVCGFAANQPPPQSKKYQFIVVPKRSEESFRISPNSMFENRLYQKGPGIYLSGPFHISDSFILYSDNLETKYSLFNLAILAIEMFFGHPTSHAPVLVQPPKPSSSIFETIALARRLISTLPCRNRAS